MAFLFALFIASIALVSAADDLEVTAWAVMGDIHSHVGSSESSGGSNSLYTFVTNSDFVKSIAESKREHKKDRIAEDVLSVGKTVVAVKKGSKSVAITTHYGVGAAAVINVRVDGQEADLASENEVNELLKPHQDIIDEVTKDAKDDEIRVIIASGGKSELKLRDTKEDDRVKVHGGFVVGSKTKVERKGIE